MSPRREFTVGSMMEAISQKEEADADLEHWEGAHLALEATPGLVLPELAGYTLIRLSGKGSFARVFKARVNRTGDMVAVKIPHAPGQVDRRRDRIHRSIIKHEAAILDVVRGGPHIITAAKIRHLHEFEASPELPMDWYEHNLVFLMDISKRDRGLIDCRVAIPTYYFIVLTQMLEALEFLHTKKIMVVHRDIKPANILYNRVDQFVLADFGGAVFGKFEEGIEGGPEAEQHKRKNLHQASGAKGFYRGDALDEFNGAASGAFAGSFEYRAPEIYSRGGLQQTPVDIWSMGILCMQILNMIPAMDKTQMNLNLERAMEWVDAAALIADVSERPEIQQMVVLIPKDRSTASELLRLIRNTLRINNSMQASAGLLYIYFRNDPRFSGWTADEIGVYIIIYRIHHLQGGPAPPKPIPKTRDGQNAVASAEEIDFAAREMANLLVDEIGRRDVPGIQDALTDLVRERLVTHQNTIRDVTAVSEMARQTLAHVGAAGESLDRVTPAGGTPPRRESPRRQPLASQSSGSWRSASNSSIASEGSAKREAARGAPSLDSVKKAEGSQRQNSPRRGESSQPETARPRDTRKERDPAMKIPKLSASHTLPTPAANVPPSTVLPPPPAGLAARPGATTGSSRAPGPKQTPDRSAVLSAGPSAGSSAGPSAAARSSMARPEAGPSLTTVPFEFWGESLSMTGDSREVEHLRHIIGVAGGTMLGVAAPTDDVVRNLWEKDGDLALRVEPERPAATLRAPATEIQEVSAGSAPAAREPPPRSFPSSVRGSRSNSNSPRVTPRPSEASRAGPAAKTAGKMTAEKSAGDKPSGPLERGGSGGGPSSDPPQAKAERPPARSKPKPKRGRGRR